MDPAVLSPVLVAIGMCEALGQSLDAQGLEQLAHETHVPVSDIRTACFYAYATGLAHLSADDAPCPPQLTEAGRQYLQLRGRVDPLVLSFLPFTVDDLHGRRALLRAGALLVDEFRQALLAGRGAEHAAALVPPAFAPAITERIALDLFAAATVLIARLEAEQPSACLAEELMALELVNYARSWLEVEAGRAQLTLEELRHAKLAVSSVLGLFGDSAVEGMEQFKEPADAALAEDGPDQRLDAWFRPFAHAPATGYLTPDPA